MSHIDHTANEQLVLSLLTAHGGMTPQQLAEKSDGKLARGGVYPALTSLQRSGCVAIVEMDGRAVWTKAGGAT